jgi:Flp pilus assembly protein TadG
MRFVKSKALDQPTSRRRTGAAVVEFAFVAPLLAMIIMGMIELSRAVMVKVTLSDAARAGCRAGIKRDKANADIIQLCADVMAYNGFNSTKFSPNTIGSVSITVTDGNGNIVNTNATYPNGETLDAPAGSFVSVQVSIPVSSTTWVPSVFMQQGSLESETVVMMKQ